MNEKLIWKANFLYSPELLSCDIIPFIGLKLTMSEIREFCNRFGCGVAGSCTCVCWSDPFCTDLWLLLFNSIEVSSSPNIFDKWPSSFVLVWLCVVCDFDAECISTDWMGCCICTYNGANSLYSLNLTSFLRALLEFWLFCVIDRMAELFISLAIAAAFDDCITLLLLLWMYESASLNTLLISASNSNMVFADCVLLCDDTTVLVCCESHSLPKSSSLPSKILFKLRCAVRNGYVDGLPIEME